MASLEELGEGESDIGFNWHAFQTALNKSLKEIKGVTKQVREFTDDRQILYQPSSSLSTHQQSVFSRTTGLLNAYKSKRNNLLQFCRVKLAAVKHISYRKFIIMLLQINSNQ